jgi:hypothetical protein
MGGSEAEIPVPPETRSAEGLRASDADRDEVADRLRDEYVAGRLSHDTFMHRMDAVLAAKQVSDLPPLLTGLPVPQPQAARAESPARGLAIRLRYAWTRLTRQLGGPWTGAALSRPAARGVTMGMRANSGPHRPISLQFPRGPGNQFSIGRDASCDLVIVDMSVSRRHATLDRVHGGWLLTDLESTNGSRVNGWRIYGPVLVHPGDLVCFGNIEYELAAQQEPRGTA